MDNNLPGSFNDLIANHPKPILVDFWAEWCGPCKMVAPVIEQLAKEWKDRVTVVKINTDEKPEVASQYGIQSIPTIIMFKGGQEVHRVVGALSPAAMKAQFEPHI